jgi:hypothetical protein
MPDVFIPTPRGQMSAWLAVPSNSGPVDLYYHGGMLRCVRSIASREHR